jgi:hypothetical protein
MPESARNVFWGLKFSTNLFVVDLYLQNKKKIDLLCCQSCKNVT